MSETAMSEEAMREADMSGDCPHLWPSRWTRGAACAVGRARSLGANARLVGENVHVGLQVSRGGRDPRKQLAEKCPELCFGQGARQRNGELVAHLSDVLEVGVGT